MIRIISIIFIVSILIACQREDPEPSSKAFYKIYGGDYQEEGMDLLETEDGGFIMVGYTTSKSNGNEKDIFIVKTNEFGLAEWTRILLDGNQLDDEATRIVRTLEDSENYVVVGTSGLNNTDSARSDIFACKISVNGDINWQQTYDTYFLTGEDTITNKADFGVDVQMRLNGNFVVVGNSLFDDGFEMITFIANQQGERIDDMFTFGLESEGDGEVNDAASRVINNQNPSISAAGLIVGTSDAPQSANEDVDNVYVLYYSENLTNISESILTGVTNQKAEDVIWALDGGYMVLSTFDYDATSGFGKLRLLKVNSNSLNIQPVAVLSDELPGNFDEEVVKGKAIARGNGRYVIAAEYKESVNADSDVLIIETDAAGRIRWHQFYGGDYTDKINSLIITSDGSIVYTGMQSFFNSDQVTKMILVKANASGNIVP